MSENRLVDRAIARAEKEAGLGVINWKAAIPAGVLMDFKKKHRHLIIRKFAREAFQDSRITWLGWLARYKATEAGRGRLI